MIIAIATGVLVAGAVYLFSRREMLRVILGFVLLSHAVNLTIIASGGTSRRGEPLGSDLDPATTADPLPQAFVLTAIVIAFAITIVMLVMAVTGRHDDDLADASDDDPAETDGDDRATTTAEEGAA
ncbi:sodium:proton antiporter [Litorihabitans aurantiacus]|uniref:Cation:proton antiporter n=1 Tax=Litorihabitans aurantiacus TaxID=1930061 RepID=A0AA37XH60_9MICO|nr:cation:proton antiporter subunit C [Litorihabitans aurantiacus]GMA32991.1 cation:proton antiporter [Litorihabitans aurantiacus]